MARSQEAARGLGRGPVGPRLDAEWTAPQAAALREPGTAGEAGGGTKPTPPRGRSNATVFAAGPLNRRRGLGENEAPPPADVTARCVGRRRSSRFRRRLAAAPCGAATFRPVA